MPKKKQKSIIKEWEISTSPFSTVVHNAACYIMSMTFFAKVFHCFIVKIASVQMKVCQKTGEISLLKQQLRDSQADISHKLNEIVSLRASLKENTAKMEMLQKHNKDNEDKLHSRTVEVEVSLSVI